MKNAQFNEKQLKMEQLNSINLVILSDRRELLLKRLRDSKPNSAKKNTEPQKFGKNSRKE